MNCYWILLLLLLYSSPPSSSGQTTDPGQTENYGLSPEAWVVVGVIVFGVVFVLSVTWILFICSLCKTDREYKKFVKSLEKYRRRRRQNQQRRQVSSPSGERPPPTAITYRRDLRSPAEVYVSLAQLTAMLNRGAPRNDRPREQLEMDVTPSAPPFPDSPPDYYEFMTQEDMQQRDHHLQREQETEFIHQSNVQR